MNKLGKGLRATMWAVDNKQIEGIEHVSLPIYGVQWHPEMSFRTDENSVKIFKAFVAGAKSAKNEK